MTADRLRILVVDDDDDTLHAIVDTLAIRHQVRGALGVGEAMAALVHEVPDVIVCDYQMPLTTGDVLLSFVARHHPAVRRVLFSGADPTELAARLAPKVAHVILQKPGTLASLLQAVTPAP